MFASEFVGGKHVQYYINLRVFVYISKEVTASFHTYSTSLKPSPLPLVLLGEEAADDSTVWIVAPAF